jgi:hypothetical protein
VFGIVLALRVLGFGVAVLAHPVGRRLLATLLITSVCAGVVAFVFTYPEAPQTPAGSRLASAAPTMPDSTGRPGGGAPSDRQQRARPAPRPSVGAASPEAAAAAWYARRTRLPRDRVRVLQRDRVNATTFRVLVLADGGNGRLDTAVVTVRRDRAGWRVSR